jgi:hypothetical protein
MEAPVARARHAGGDPGHAAGGGAPAAAAAAVAAVAAAAAGGHASGGDLARVSDAPTFELRMSQPQSQDLVAQLAEPLHYAPLSQGGSQTVNGDLLASLPQDGTQASQPLVADRAPAGGGTGSGGARSKPPAARAAAVEADAKPAGATPPPPGAGGAVAAAAAGTPAGRARSASVDPALGAAAAMVGGAEEIRTHYPVRGSDALPIAAADMFQGLSDGELEAVRGLQELLPEQAAAAAAAAAGKLPEAQLRLAELAALGDGSAAMALLAGAQFPPPPPPPAHVQQHHMASGSGGGGGNGGGGNGRKKPKGVHPSLRKAEHRLSRATRRGPMDEMRQLMRILTKLLTADTGVRQVLVEDQVGRGGAWGEGPWGRGLARSGA